jgi:hypothetical protein
MKTNNEVLNAVLEQTVDFRTDVLNRQIAWAEKQSERKCTEREIEFMRLAMVYDLAKSIGKYVVDTDVLVGEWSAFMDCGKLTISANIQRDGEVFPFATDVIYAGGYNIQCYHIRYIVKTKLSRIGKMEDAKEINEVIKQMKKEDRIADEIALVQKGINRAQDYINANDGKSDEQLMEIFIAECWKYGADDETYRYKSFYNHLTGRYGWNNMNDQSKQHYGSQDAYEAELSERWNRAAIVEVREKVKRCKHTVKSYSKKVEKLQQKLELLQQAA